MVTTGNRYDSPLLPKLLEDLEADYVLADSGYYSLRNIKFVLAMSAQPVIVINPRQGTQRKVVHGELLREKRYLVEQFNGHVKDNILKECWFWPRGLVKKAAMVMAGLISYDAEALKSLLLCEASLKSVSKSGFNPLTVGYGASYTPNQWCTRVKAQSCSQNH